MEARSDAERSSHAELERSVGAVSDIELRPMLEADLLRADEVWARAFATSTEFPQRTEPLSLSELAQNLDRRRHLLTHDPEGSFVATSAGLVVGLAQGHRRGDTYGLAMLAVDPAFQDRGIGRALLDRALTYASGARAQYIFSSSDPRALHRYVQAGFFLHPTVRITPRDDMARPTSAAVRVSTNSEVDLDAVDAIDQAVRDTTRRPDVQFWLRNETQLLIHEAGGYAFLNPTRLVALGATSDEIAAELLHSVLGGYPDGVKRSLGWVVQDQQWAIVQATNDKATIEVHGAMMTRGLTVLPRPYLPNGLFG